MGADFRTRFVVIFSMDDPLYKKQVDAHLSRLRNELGKRVVEEMFTVSCLRENPVDAINQMKNLWTQCKPKNPEGPYITADISCFTKIYLLELLHYLVMDLNLGIPRMIHTTQKYLPSRLTNGISQITTVPNFFGSPSLEKRTILILLLGFEPERSLAVWHQFNPAKTIALITNPPRFGNADYVKYAEENNSHLLSQPSVEVRGIPADNPFAVKNVLEGIYNEVRGSYNMVIGPFGTKPQTVGVFMFCLEHTKTQVVYSFPAKYTKSYLQRTPGPTILLPLAPSIKM
jgi:hypothetical protein